MAVTFLPYNSRSDLDAISYSSRSDTNLVNPCCQWSRYMPSEIGRVWDGCKGGTYLRFTQARQALVPLDCAGPAFDLGRDVRNKEIH